MVASLSAEVTPTDVAPSLNKAPDAEHVERDEDQRWLVPDHTWHRRNYEHAIMHYIATGDDDKAADIEKAFRDYNVVLLDADSWQAIVEYIRLFFSKGWKLWKINMFSEKNDINEKVIGYFVR